jgi:hypothetical protein
VFIAVHIVDIQDECAACCVVRPVRRDYDEAKGSWVWAKEAPASQKAPGGDDSVKKLRKKVGPQARRCDFRAQHASCLPSGCASDWL